MIRPKIKYLFWGATFHIPLTKSATLNRLLHCSLWQFLGAFFFLRALFLHFGGEIAQSLCVFFPDCDDDESPSQNLAPPLECTLECHWNVTESSSAPCNKLSVIGIMKKNLSGIVVAVLRGGGGEDWGGGGRWMLKLHFIP